MSVGTAWSAGTLGTGFPWEETETWGAREGGKVRVGERGESRQMDVLTVGLFLPSTAAIQDLAELSQEHAGWRSLWPQLCASKGGRRQ